MVKGNLVGHRDEYLSAIAEGRLALFAEPNPADTLVAVETLAHGSFV
jgi:hypothetical protein